MVLAMNLQHKTSKIRIHAFDAGPCPVQACGSVGPHRWYFRARGRTWVLRVSKDPAVDPTQVSPNGPGLFMEQDYEGAEANAGHMSRDEAERLIRESLESFIAA